MKYPVVGQTVKTTVQLGITFGVALVIFAAAEFFKLRKSSERIRILCLSLPTYLIRTVRLVLATFYLKYCNGKWQMGMAVQLDE